MKKLMLLLVFVFAYGISIGQDQDPKPCSPWENCGAEWSAEKTNVDFILFNQTECWYGVTYLY